MLQQEQEQQRQKPMPPTTKNVLMTTTMMVMTKAVLHLLRIHRAPPVLVRLHDRPPQDGIRCRNSLWAWA